MRFTFVFLLFLVMSVSARADVTSLLTVDSAVSASRPEFVRESATSDRSVRLNVADDSDSQNLTLYLQREVNPVFGPGGSAETGLYEALCPLPCDLSFRPGTYVFGISAGSGPTIKADRALRLRGGEQVTFDYDDRKLLRASGWVLMLTGAAGGGTLLALGQAGNNVTQSVSGGVLSAVCIVAGLWLANLRDRAGVAVKP